MNDDDASTRVAAMVVAVAAMLAVLVALLCGVLVATGSARGSADAQIGAEIRASIPEVAAALASFDREPVNHATLAGALNRLRFGYAPGSSEVPPGDLEIVERAARLLIGLGDSHRLGVRGGADRGLPPAAAESLARARADAIRDVFVAIGVPDAAVLSLEGDAGFARAEFVVLD